jgi:hypothetical protein
VNHIKRRSFLGRSWLALLLGVTSLKSVTASPRNEMSDLGDAVEDVMRDFCSRGHPIFTFRHENLIFKIWPRGFVDVEAVSSERLAKMLPENREGVSIYSNHIGDAVFRAALRARRR